MKPSHALAVRLLGWALVSFAGSATRVVHAASEREAPVPAMRHTTISIVGEEFYINGEPTYKGRTWNGRRIQGLLFNARMVQGIFDDQNPQTAKQWAYPDT